MKENLKNYGLADKGWKKQVWVNKDWAFMTTQGYCKNDQEKSYLIVGRQGTGTLFLNWLTKVWLPRITCAFLNNPFSSTREREESELRLNTLFSFDSKADCLDWKRIRTCNKLFTFLRFIRLHTPYPNVANSLSPHHNYVIEGEWKVWRYLQLSSRKILWPLFTFLSEFSFDSSLLPTFPVKKCEIIHRNISKHRSRDTNSSNISTAQALAVSSSKCLEKD